MSLKIIDVKLIGICSKHKRKDNEIPRYNNGNIVEDKDISCVACSVSTGSCLRRVEMEKRSD